MKVEHVDFRLVQERIKHYWNPFEYNPHQGWLGTSRSGKSYAIRHGILPIAGNSRIIVMDVKPGGERTWNDYGNLVTELKPGFGKGVDGTPHYHMMVTSAKQAQKTIEMISNEGSCVLVFDDSRKITQNSPGYNLSSNVDELIYLGAAIGITVIICANSTVWATSGLRDQCGINWIGQMQNEDERKKFARQSGLDKEIVPILGKLPPRHFLYKDAYDGNSLLGITHFTE